MKHEQLLAFEQAAGANIHVLSHSIKLVIAVTAGLWIIWMLGRMYQNFQLQKNYVTLVDITRALFSSLLIFTIVLILIN